jgi:cytoskeletal protein CcmA (bactofilin family)
MAFSNNHTLISRGTRVVGDLHFSGDLQLEGQVIGNIIAEETKESKLIIADTGVVEGEIRAPIIVVNGRVDGNIYASKHLELAKKGSVTGNVHYNAIEIVNGARINGNLISSVQEASTVTSQPATQHAKDTKGKVHELVQANS